MPKGIVKYHYQNTSFKLQKSRSYTSWIQEIISNESFQLARLEYIFCDDSYLLEINQNFLNHDDYTDIITFDLGQEKGNVEGEIYISIERVKENASTHQTTFQNELLRVMAHGVLHLCGYLDKKEKDIQLMRKKEEICISIFNQMFHVEH